MSLDGCIGLPGPKPLKLSSREDFRRVHELRSQSDAILVGVGTVLVDDPKLTVKWELLDRPPGRNPLRVVLDARLRTPANAQVGSDAAPTIVFHQPGAKGGPKNAARFEVPVVKGRLELGAVLRELERRGVRHLMVEGGAQVIGAFLSEGLADEFTVYVAPKLVGLKDAPRLFDAKKPVELALTLREPKVLGEGVLLHWSRRA